MTTITFPEKGRRARGRKLTEKNSSSYSRAIAKGSGYDRRRIWRRLLVYILSPTQLLANLPAKDASTQTDSPLLTCITVDKRHIDSDSLILAADGRVRAWTQAIEEAFS